MQHIADTWGAATPVQLGSAEHVQLGSAEHVQLGSPEHELLFRAVLEEVKVCRAVRNVTLVKFRRKPGAHRAELASDHSKVDKVFAQAAALSEGIQLESLTPRVYDYQWQPASIQERQRHSANKRLESANITRSAASASGHSTPSRHQKCAANALQNELKRLDSRSPLQSKPSVIPPEQSKRHKAATKLATQQRRYDENDHAHHPGHGFSPETMKEDSPLQQAQRKRLSEVPQHVFDCTSNWNGTEEFWSLVDLKQLVELDMTNERMRKHYEIIPGGVQAECGVWNVGGKPAYCNAPAFLERGLLPRLLTAIAVMVIHSLCVSDCTVFCLAMWF